MAACDSVIAATATNWTRRSSATFGKNALAANRKLPTLMAARAVTKPARLNQAVPQPQPRPPRMAAQWYSPPAVGNADAICPIVAATASDNRHMTGHPSPMAAPPTLQYPKRERRQPAGQNANDRQRNGIVRKTTQAAGQFLGVAQAVKRAHVVDDGLLLVRIVIDVHGER